MAGIVSRKIKKVGHEISLIPVMSLFLILVPMLLLTAEFERAAVIDLFLPSSDIKPGNQMTNGPVLDLTIAISPDKITVKANKERVTINAKIEGNERELDLTKLNRELYSIKKKHPNSGEIVILIDGDVQYDTIIQVMDAAREIKFPDGKIIKLFPNVALADRVVVSGANEQESNEENILHKTEER